jgi:hypothetical protein
VQGQPEVLAQPAALEQLGLLEQLDMLEHTVQVQILLALLAVVDKQEALVRQGLLVLLVLQAHQELLGQLGLVGQAEQVVLEGLAVLVGELFA